MTDSAKIKEIYDSIIKVIDETKTELYKLNSSCVAYNAYFENNVIDANENYMDSDVLKDKMIDSVILAVDDDVR